METRIIENYVKRHQEHTKMSSVLYGLLAFIFESALVTMMHPDSLMIEMIILIVSAIAYIILFLVCMQKRYNMMKMQIGKVDYNTRRMYVSEASFPEAHYSQFMIAGCFLCVFAILCMDVVKIELYDLFALEMICVVILSIGCGLIYYGNASKSLTIGLGHEGKQCSETLRSLFASAMFAIGLIIMTQKIFFVIAMAIFPAGLLLFCLLALSRYLII